MNKIFKLSFVFLVIFVFVNFFISPVLAEDIVVDPEENTEESENLIIEGNIILKNDCTVTDADEVVHIFPNADSPSEYLGICALEEARESEIIESFGLVNDPSFGLYVESINGIAPSSTEFWSLWHNGSFAECGIGCLALAAGDTLSLILTDWMTNTESATIMLNITETELDVLPDEEEEIEQEEQTEEVSEEGEENEEEEQAPPSGGGGGGGSPAPSPEFDISQALSFLVSQQNSDGSFSNTLISDWAAIAFSASESNSEARSRLYNYLLTAPDAGSEITDYERRAMALLALGINPYDGTSVDYITPIIDSFDGTQIGESFPHDDIFAIFPLLHAGYDADDEIIQKITAYIVQTQNGNGSWGDPDSTAAAIQALSLVESEPGVSSALRSAKAYLKGQQQPNGGFGNSFSTSWALQAIAALGESAADWSVNGKTPMDYLAELQEADGGVDRLSTATDFRTWATSYAIVAAPEKTWSEIMESFSKPASENHSDSPKSNTSANTDTEMPTEPVICPAGDLFSTLTGEPCTEFIALVSPEIATPPVVVPTIADTTTARSPARTTLAGNNSATTNTENENGDAQEIDNIQNDALMATAIEALPNQTTPYTAPIVLATVSGLVLLYAAFKFFIL